MPQPMATPTADGITAVSVGIAEPIVAPIPKCASGISARWPTRIGSRAVRAACSVVSSSSSLAQERTFGAISFGMTLTPSFVSGPRPGARPRWSALRVLRRLAGLLEAVLPAFLLAGVACQEPLGFELRSELGVELDERPRDAEPDGPGLAGDPAAADRDGHVVVALALDRGQRPTGDHAMHARREVVVDRAPVDREPAVAGREPDTCDRALAAYCRELRSDCDHVPTPRCRSSSWPPASCWWPSWRSSPSALRRSPWWRSSPSALRPSTSWRSSASASSPSAWRPLGSWRPWAPAWPAGRSTPDARPTQGQPAPVRRAGAPVPARRAASSASGARSCSSEACRGRPSPPPRPDGPPSGPCTCPPGSRPGARNAGTGLCP